MMMPLTSPHFGCETWTTSLLPGESKLQSLSSPDNRRNSSKFTIRVISRSGKKLSTSVYNTERRLIQIGTETSYQSYNIIYHHPRVMTGTIACPRNRTDKVCTKEDEKKYLQEVFGASECPPPKLPP